MRWALQKFTLVSSLSVTVSRASRYSRESTSKACCSSTERETDRENVKQFAGTLDEKQWGTTATKTTTMLLMFLWRFSAIQDTHVPRGYSFKELPWHVMWASRRMLLERAFFPINHLISPTCRPWSLSLTFPGPLVRLQHQVLFGLFQLFLQTLVLGSDFADSLLPVLQQAKLGADIHHLLMRRERTCSVIFFFKLTSIPGTGCCVTCASVTAGGSRFYLFTLNSANAAGCFRTLSSFVEAVGGKVAFFWLERKSLFHAFLPHWLLPKHHRAPSSTEYTKV